MPAVTNLTCAVLDEPLARLRQGGGDPAATPALREPKRVWSYEKLFEEVCRAGGALLAQGLKPGDRVVLFMHDGMELAATLLGAVRAGLCAVPLPDTLRARELLDVLRDSGAQAVVAHADLTELLAEVLSGAPRVRVVLSLGGSRPGQLDFAALCWAVEPTLPPAAPASGHPAFLLYHTSPDGRPRAHAYPHELALLAYDSYADAVVSLQPEDRVFSTTRLSSSFGLGLGLLFPLRAGCVSYFLPDQIRGRAVFDVLGSFRPTLLAATPSIYSQLLHEYLEMSAPRPAYFKSVRISISMGEPMPPLVERRLRAVFQLEPLHAYSAAEALHVVLSNRERALRAGSCGRPVPSVQARVVNDQGQVAAPAEIGQLEVRGPQLGSGLWCGLTHAMLPAPTGWVTLPDRFFVDDDGFFFHVGRSDGMFKVCGHLVSPVEIEQVLLGHPVVWECAVTEDEDEDGLPVPKAYVVLNVGSEPSGKLARELLDFVKRQISPHKVPRAVEFISQLPRSQDGRVARWRLRSRPPSAPLSPPSGMTPIRLGDLGDKEKV